MTVWEALIFLIVPIAAWLDFFRLLIPYLRLRKKCTVTVKAEALGMESWRQHNPPEQTEQGITVRWGSTSRGLGNRVRWEYRYQGNTYHVTEENGGNLWNIGVPSELLINPETPQEFLNPDTGKKLIAYSVFAGFFTILAVMVLVIVSKIQ